MQYNDFDKLWIDTTIEKIQEKMAWVAEDLCGTMPAVCRNGFYDDRKTMQTDSTELGISWWTNGFFGGLLWQLYYETKLERYAQIASVLEDQMDACFEDYYGLHHDVGFMWQPTSVASYKLTGNQLSKKRALHAACILAGRFNPVGFIRAWNDNPAQDTKGWAIIDSLMNLSLLYWASQETLDPRYKNIAKIHTETVSKNFIRPDNTFCHIVEFNPQTGERVKSHGGQGFGHGSSWTRGQAWAIYGLTIGFLHTGEKTYLETALQVADYFIANIPESGIIPIDFRQPKEPALMDDTAAAIAASSLLELSKLVEAQQGARYQTAALLMLKAITNYHCDWSRERQAILTSCSSSYHAKEHHLGFMYADYFYVEALYKLKGDPYFLW